MSRTYRRKNYELTQNTSWDRRARHAVGLYNEYSWKASINEHGETYGYIMEYRECTERERNDKYWDIHCESRNRNMWSPGRNYRNPRMRQNRRINKEEVRKFLCNQDYEPMTEDNPRSCLWDWS